MGERNGVQSRWWYGIAVTTGVGIVAYGFVLILSGYDMESIRNAGGSLFGFAVAAIGFWVSGVVVLVLTLVFVVCFIADWYRVNDAAADWHPSGVYLLVPLVSLVNFVVPVLSLPIMVVGGGWYLLRRSEQLGVPARPLL